MRDILSNVIRNQSGQSAPVVVLLLIAVGALIVTPLLGFMVTGLKAGQMHETKTLEYYAADSGVEDALWHMQYDEQFELPDQGEDEQWQLPETIDDRSVDVTLSNEGGGIYKITSVATSADGSSTTVECYLDILGGPAAGGSSVWDYALCSLGGNITLFGNSEVESDEVLGGDIHANGNVSVSGNAVVDGNATATGDITVSQNGDINGVQTEGAEPLTAPVIDNGTYKAEARDIGCEYITCGNITHTSLPISTSQVFPNRVHVQQGLTVTGICTVTFNDTVCVDGNLNIQSITDVTFKGPVKVGGSVTISDNSKVIFQDNLCVAVNMQVSSNANVTLNGAVKVGGDLNLLGNKDVPFAGTVYVGGNLATSGNKKVRLGGTVYVCGAITGSDNSANFIGAEYVFAETGNITLSGNTQVAAAEIPLFMAIAGSVKISGNSATYAIVYAPNGSISFGDNSQLNGCAVGQSITLGSNSKVVYPINLRERSDLPGSGGGGGTGVGLQILTYTIT